MEGKLETFVGDEVSQNQNCLIGAFSDGSIATAAAYLMKQHNGTINKDKKEKDEIDYKFWCNMVEGHEILIDASCEESSMNLTRLDITYALENEGELCRKNWCFMHNISINSTKRFSQRYKSELVDRFHVEFQNKTFSDTTYTDLPYQQMKTVFEELKLVGKKLVLVEIIVVVIVVIIV